MDDILKIVTNQGDKGLIILILLIGMFFGIGKVDAYKKMNEKHKWIINKTLLISIVGMSAVLVFIYIVYPVAFKHASQHIQHLKK